ncbi:MAG: DUF285 domain-containing protein, partial [Clostridia bacterium]|nr:DUF285 domain-containing protein [Clostridia bacterium]
MKRQRFIHLFLTFLCAVFFVCAGFAVSNILKRENTVAAHAETEVTSTIYWGVKDSTLNISSGPLSSAYYTGTQTGNFSSTQTLSGQWLSYRNKITDVNFLTTIVAANTANWFSGFNKLTTINIEKLDTSNVRLMHNMFNGCSSLTSLELSNFNTSNVTNMGSLFQNCSSLSALDVSGFVFSNCTNAINLFASCVGLAELNLGNADLSQATISNMFGYLYNLKQLSISESLASKIVDTNLFGTGGPVSWYGSDGTEYNADNPMTEAGLYTSEKPECQHDWQLQGEAANLCVGGSEEYVCSKCGATDTKSITALGHAYVAGAVTAPTCTERG